MNADNVLVIATGNPHKRREFEALLDDFLHPMWEIYDLSEWPEPLSQVDEDQASFRGNALKKAERASLETNATALADDSGLEVDALGGEPGVESSRFAGPDASDEANNEKLLEELDGVPDSERTARFVCVIGLVLSAKKLGRALMERAGVRFRDIPFARPTEPEMVSRVDDRAYIWFRGTVEGRILDDPRGEGGFGYDPLFYVPDRDATMAELAADEKHEVSHRASAVDKMKDYFRNARNP